MFKYSSNILYGVQQTMVKDFEQRKQILRKFGFTEQFILDALRVDPALFPVDSVKEKIKGLEQLGFSDPVKLIIKCPPIFHYSITSIQEKIEWLKERGFKDPVKMVTGSPMIIGLKYQNIEQRISFFAGQGFTDPIKMISICPPFLNYSLDNIKEKIKILDKLISLYHLDCTTVELIENNFGLLGSKIDKLWILARIIQETARGTEEVNGNLIRKLLHSNLEDVILASKVKEKMKIEELLASIKQIKERNIPKEEKRNEIAQIPKGDKVRKKYFRGYPTKYSGR